MTALDKKPKTLSQLSPTGFTFNMKRSPNLNFWVQKVSIPGFSIAAPNAGTPFVKIPHSGDHIDFETLDVIFTVDEELSNYLEIWTWLKSLGFPEKYEQYAELLKNPKWTSLGVKSEIIVTILSNKKNPAVNFVFHDAFPIGISRLDFDTRLQGPGPIYCQATFLYRDYDVERVNPDYSTVLV